MSRRLLVYVGLGFSLWSAGARAQEPASPAVKQEPSAAPAAQAPAPEPSAPAAEPAAPAPAAEPAPAPPVPPAPPPPPAAAPTPAAQVHEGERAPSHELVPPPPGFFVRLAPGFGVNFLTAGSESSRILLRGWLQLDGGYGFTPDFAVLLRVSTWLSYDPLALHFLGAGVRLGVAPDNMFVNALLGVSIADSEFGFQGGGDESVQGLALHAEVGQSFSLAGAWWFEIGAHFGLGTPFFASDTKFTSIEFGPFVALRFGG